MSKKLYRSRNNKMLTGVCGGVAEYFDMDPTIIRLIAVVILVAGNIGAVIGYFVAGIIIPESPYDYTAPDHVDYDPDEKKN